VSDHDLYPEGQTFITLDEIDAEFDKQQFMRRRLSDCSTCSSLSFSDLEYATGVPQPEVEDEQQVEDEEYVDGKKISRWRTIRTIVHQLTPFIQTYKKQRYPWVQLAGHQGHFKPGEQGNILKKFCEREKEAFELLMEDTLRSFVPQYYGTSTDDAGVEYIQLEDLLGRFQNPCVMDCKIGVRTYLEDELTKAKVNPKLRNDMYNKMKQIDPNAPTPEEHQLKGVTKPRYMVWRETISTTSTFGFRIEGMRKSDGSSSKDFKTTRTEEDVKAAFSSFLKGFSNVVGLYVERLKALKAALAESNFFRTHEVIGSSLLFVHDQTSASVWMIDFAKTCLVPSGVPPISHDKPWSVGNHEDGYLVGLSNLIRLFEELIPGEELSS
jgi:1D-myo-inositol-triphosphate 3-kinase